MTDRTTLDDAAAWQDAVKVAAERFLNAPAQESIELRIGRAMSAAAPYGVWVIARQIMADPNRHDHLVQFTDDGWTLRHPAHERVGDALFSCKVMEEKQWFEMAMEDEIKPGIYKVDAISVGQGQTALGFSLVRES